MRVSTSESLGRVMNKSVSCLLLTAAILFGCASARAQVTTATLYGIVTDPTGGVVPGASVTVIHQDTNAATIQTADSRGEFTFDFLRVGVYTVRIEAPGFKKY